uniref:Lymphoid-restricted membrane protein n=1 Tax=Arion vulgaris TaxID=1028688 RepID=A0A0B6ZHL4_9EUPU
MKNRCTKLPELEENSELDTVNINLTQASTNDSHTVTEMSQIISITNDNVPSATTDDVVVPSISETFLNKLGLSIQCSSIADDVSVEQLPEKDIESKFVSLSLAFKTDKITLDQRVSVQERSRDLAEKNVDTELQDLRENVESLSELVADAQVRSVLQKIKQHINVLEQFAAKVSSRAEVYGAVQQERRMCKAMEVMVLYTENLRRIREKEESELREARKLLNERCGNGFRVDSDSGSNRRSMSVCGLNAVGRPMRRRSEVALPRIIGGVGSPSMTQTANLEHVLPFSKSSFISAISRKSTEGEDPKSRFQSAVASTTMQHVVTSTMRKCSVEKQRSTSLSSVSSLSPPLIPTSEELQFTSSSSLSVNNEQENLSESQSDKLQMVITNSQEEEAFRKGFREGLKTKLSQELNDLRDQQNSISQILEHVMDKVDTTDNEDNEYMPRFDYIFVI